DEGWLTPDERADVERLLERQLRKHHGDAHASLAAAASPDVGHLLASVHDPDIDSSLAHPSTVRTGPFVPEAGHVDEEAGAAVPGAAGRNVLIDEIGRGGMGAVFRGRDPELGRELAVKVLREDHRDRPEAVRRFVEEAQIAGQLQHPGVVPVYELGRFPGARPSFPTKLVKGRTLAALSRQRADLRQDEARFLTIFEQVCQTLAYAHSRGVLHRDLKPSNVMVGAFGEVQVMDWGLAKVLRHGTADTEGEAGTVIRTARARSTPAEESQAGTVLGTPAFMAPEQARGELDLVDERADV